MLTIFKSCIKSLKVLNEDNKTAELVCLADAFFKSDCAEFKKFTAKASGQNRTCQV